MPEVVALAIAIAAYALFRIYAARQIAKRRGAFVWVIALPFVLGPALTVWAGLRMLSSAPIIGGLLILFGAILGWAAFVFIRRVQRGVSSAAVEKDVGEALVGPMADYMATTTAVVLLFGLLGGIALVVWAILTRHP